MVFERNKDEASKLKKEISDKETRYQQIIGQLPYEIDWLKIIWPQINHLKNAKIWLTLETAG